MRLTDMTSFVVLARHRHFGRAAQELHTTQPAVSFRLVAIEKELGQKLIHRSGGEFSLTPEGERTLETFRHILTSYDTLKEELSQEKAATKVVRIGAIDSVSSTWMAPFVEELHALFPTLRLELAIESTKNLVEGMHKGEFDAIFALDPVIGDSFRSFTSCILQMSWAGSPRIVDPDRTYNVDDIAQLALHLASDESAFVTGQAFVIDGGWTAG